MAAIHELPAQEQDIRNDPVLTHPSSITLSSADIHTLQDAVTRRGGNALLIRTLSERLAAGLPLRVSDLLAAHGVLLTAGTPEAYALALRIRSVIEHDAAEAQKAQTNPHER